MLLESTRSKESLSLTLFWFSGYLGQPQSCTYVNPSVAVPCSLVPVTRDWTKADFQWSTNPDGIHRSQGLLRKFGQLWLFGRCVQGMCLHNAHLDFFFSLFSLHTARSIESWRHAVWFLSFFFNYKFVLGHLKSLKHSFTSSLMLIKLPLLMKRMNNTVCSQHKQAASLMHMHNYFSVPFAKFLMELCSINASVASVSIFRCAYKHVEIVDQCIEESKVYFCYYLNGFVLQVHAFQNTTFRPGDSFPWRRDGVKSPKQFKNKTKYKNSSSRTHSDLYILKIKTNISNERWTHVSSCAAGNYQNEMKGRAACAHMEKWTSCRTSSSFEKHLKQHATPLCAPRTTLLLQLPKPSTSKGPDTHFISCLT